MLQCSVRHNSYHWMKFCPNVKHFCEAGHAAALSDVFKLTSNWTSSGDYGRTV